MTTSASYDFSLTAAQIIQSAYEDLGVVTPGGTIASADSTMALSRLNMIVKQHQGRADGSPGLPVHTRQRITLPFALGQQTYLIGPATTDSPASTTLGRTTISNTEAVGQTVLSITSNTDITSYPGTTLTMANLDTIGIELDDGSIQWTTISGTPGVTVTVNDALRDAASSGNYVWWFTLKAQRFPYIEFAAIRDENFNDTPIDIYTQVQQYEAVVAKFADGTPTCILVEPLRLNTRVTLNIQPDDVSRQLYLTVLYPSEDYDSTSNDIAYPQEAYRYLSWELAFALSASVGRWTDIMEKNRQESRAMYVGLNAENSILYFQPNPV
jgi:hypothetical protein